MANLQPVEVYAGENRTLSFEARDPSNNVASLSGKTVSFRVGRSPRNLDSAWPILNLPGSVISAPAGTFSVAISPPDTQYMHGDYEYQAVTIDGAQQVAVVCVGRFRVRDYIQGLGNG